MTYKTLTLFLLIILFNYTLILSQCFSNKFLPGAYIIESSGEDIIDSIIYNEIEKQKVFFDLDVDFNFMYEYKDKNAFFNPYCSKNNCHGTIYLGVRMLSEQLNKTGGLESTRAILAHEFGHCVQNYINWTERSKYKELHSDFMAGFYIGKTYNYDESQINRLFKVFYELGDYGYWDPNHHGTPIERKCAFEEGYFYAKENEGTPVDAHVYAIKYLSADEPCLVRRYMANTKKYYENLAINNVGNLVITVLNDSKYSVVTLDSIGSNKKIIFNQNNITYRWTQDAPQYKLFNLDYVYTYTYKQSIPRISQVFLSNIVATNSHPLYIYKNSILMGEWLKFIKTVPIVKGRTTYVTIKDNKITYEVEY